MAEIALECRPLEILSDERLAALAAGGDDRAFAVLYGRYQAPLRRYCGGILRGSADADDVVQTTMARALASLHTRRDGAWSAWLYRIARNESLEVLRRRRPMADLDDVEYVGPWSVEATLEQRERLSRLLEDLDDLPERQRSALVLRAVNGLDPEAIGDALAMTPGAARQAIFEARSALADFEHGRDMACEQVRRAVEGGDGRRLRERRLRAHLRSCAGCRDFRDAARAGRRRRAFLPSLGFLSGLVQRLQGAGAPESLAGAKTVAAAAILAITAGLAAEAPRIGRHDPPRAGAAAAPHTVSAGTADRAARIAARAPALRTRPAVAPRRSAAAPSRRTHVVARRIPAAPAPAAGTATAAPPTWTAPVTTDPIAKPAAGERPGEASSASSSSSAVAAGPAPAAPPPATDPGAAAPPGLDGVTPPGQGGTPPGQGGEPPGQAKKADDPAPPPGQAKKEDPSWAPPGQAKKADDPTPPPGQAKKRAAIDPDAAAAGPS